MESTDDYKDLKDEISALRIQLEEANDTIEAIRTGGVDALVIQGKNGSELYTLKSADQTYRVFIEKMNEGAITLNHVGLILYCNSRFASMIGVPLNKIVGLMFSDFIAEDEKNVFSSKFNDAWTAEGKGEISLLKNNGMLTPVLFSMTTLELDEGTALSIILADLTLQKNAEQELQKKNRELQHANRLVEMLNDDLENKVRQRTRELLLSREHFKFLADNIPVIAWKADANGHINYFNKRWYEFTGYNPDESQMLDWPDIIHPDDRDISMIAWQRSVNEALPFSVEYRFLRSSDNSYQWHLGNALPYKNESGEVVAWFGIATDIEFQKKALEKKDDFINMVSHELKTPVTSIKGFTQLLMLSVQNDANPAYKSYLATMNNQINKLTRLISDLLDATKFKRGQLQFNEEQFDFNLLATEIINEMQLISPKHRINIDFDSTAMISGDKNRVGQVITNLISNAIKYSPDADSILISTSNKNDCIEFCVKDFGIGIPVAQQAQLYTRFFRVVDNNSHTFPGMGLGLYISMGIIEKHHGRMWVKSESGQGSEFYFSLPIAN